MRRIIDGVRRALVLVVFVGCYAPSAQPGAKCADNKMCPEGLVCSPATGTCEVSATPQDGAVGDDGMMLDGQIADAAPDGPPPMATLVQQATNQVGAAAMLQVTLPAVPVSGHVLVMIGGTPSGSLDSVTGGGATWTRAASSVENTNVETWFGVTDGSSAVVTLARANNFSPMWGLVIEWSGLATTQTLDQAALDNALSNTVSAGSITTTHAYDLLVFDATAAAGASFGMPTPGTWTALPNVLAGLSVLQVAWYRVETATGTFAPQVTKTGGGAWDANLVALRIAP